MEQIEIGSSGLKTSRVGLGTCAIGGWMSGGADERQAIATIRSAIERGVTLIDTAPVYGLGNAEDIVKKALSGGLRDKVQIATKVGLAWKDGKVYRDSLSERLSQELDDSLRRLGTDAIDLCQVHWPDLDTPFEEAALVLEKLRLAGKIRAIGVSKVSPAQMEVFRAVARLDAVQPPYNLFEREVEADVLPYAKNTNLTVLSYGALCRGLLSRRMTRSTIFDGDDHRKVYPELQGDRFPHYVAALDELATLARERFDKSVVALAVRWVLDQGPTIALWGARRPDQLDLIGDIEGWHIDEESKRDIDAILARCMKELPPNRISIWRRADKTLEVVVRGPRRDPLRFGAVNGSHAKMIAGSLAALIIKQDPSVSLILDTHVPSRKTIEFVRKEVESDVGEVWPSSGATHVHER